MRTPMASTARLILSHAVILLLLLLCAAKPATSYGWIPVNPSSYLVEDTVLRALRIYDDSIIDNRLFLIFFRRGLRAKRMSIGPKIFWDIEFQGRMYICNDGMIAEVSVHIIIILAHSHDMFPQINWQSMTPWRG
ncbi:hypothetical protein AXF42_Ash012540 [Apostasia shenzhenica]|uniref:Uncharacterized protein n=1 Tax=Apostasia shenzhenica TaxID=1088818 RepID=A0A2I0AR22_9ASPA|nr:hypothetical protein AXF42_Ash012540 [Apostasia shenzhenica]